MRNAQWCVMLKRSWPEEDVHFDQLAVELLFKQITTWLIFAFLNVFIDFP